ncbi:helix-turn-helix domain-containing protein [Lacipirellula parvula]|uniref:Helix-turn-helix domain-containing protein n=1 Tax=Lacipirellula parvula TaxID=2650471 RepID=A0A5K7X817_9BACT|nr:helix-turn-helix domain-containing protein [Lacipirellula parvula]BBO31947.1 hypothetical protein PLANPX_1559 [Lacipirellula parvula]
MAPSATLSAPSSVHLTKQEAADFLNVSLRTLDRLDIAKVKIRGRVLYRRDTLDAWSKSQESVDVAG